MKRIIIEIISLFILFILCSFFITEVKDIGFSELTSKDRLCIVFSVFVMRIFISLTCFFYEEIYKEYLKRS